ncbi:MAG: glyoxalase [Chloroflexi bacterium]|nr:glyoxalase [Chloroflexota bacterium]
MKVRLQHVSIPRPPGSENLTRAFYGEILGLEEIPVPSTIQQFDLIWFALGPETELHVFAEEAFSDQSGRHFCLVVEDLDGLKHKLAEAGIETWEPATIQGRPRFFCRDPFRNIIEFTTIEADYKSFEE